MGKYNIKKTESGKYYLLLRVGNKRVSITKSTEAEVKAAADRLKAEQVLKIKQSAYIAKTLGGMIDEFIDTRRDVLSPSTINGYKNIRKNRFKSYMSMKADKINYQRMINDEARSCSPKTVKNAWGLISAALDYNGCDVPTVRLPASVKTEHAYLQPDQITLFIETIKDQPCEMACLLGLSSLRKSEIFALQYKDIDFKKKTIHVHSAYVIDEDNHYTIKKSTKTLGSDRYVPIMIPRLMELLKASDPEAPVLVTGYPSNLYKQIARVCESMEIDNIGVHGLRHSFASLAYHLQIPERIAMQIGGWTDINTMHRIYTHIAEKDISKASDKFFEFFS